MTTNNNLHKARKARQDEFYTRLEDIEKELQHYPGAFRDKVVYLNTDDPKHSQFWAFFADNFATLGLEQLIATHYTPGATSSTATVKTHAGTTAYSIEGDGDFRSAECIEFLKSADVVVTNPPFSLFREYVAQLVEHGKKFLILGNMNAITYKEIFPLIRDGKMWLGTRSGAMEFRIPTEYSGGKSGIHQDKTGQWWKKLGFITWFTNLDHKRRHEEQILYRKYDPAVHPKYSNYDAINVDKVKDIPQDYDGAIGVPITFLGKWNPEQFEIIGLDRYTEGNRTPGKRMTIQGRECYARILIRNLKPETPTGASA